MDELPELSTNEEEEIVTEELYEEGMEDPYKDQITIDDTNILTEMKTSQMATQEEEEQDSNVPTHGYNLRKHPTNIHDNPPKSTRSHNAYPDECEGWAIDFWRKRKQGNFKGTETVT